MQDIITKPTRSESSRQFQPQFASNRINSDNSKGRNFNKNKDRKSLTNKPLAELIAKWLPVVVKNPYLANNPDLAVKLIEAEEMALLLLEHKQDIIKSLPDAARMFVEDDKEEMFRWVTDNSQTHESRAEALALLRTDFHLLKAYLESFKKTDKKELDQIYDFVRSRVIFEKPFESLDQVQSNVDKIITQVEGRMGFDFYSIKVTMPDPEFGGFSDIKIYFTKDSRYFEGEKCYYEVQVNTLKTVLCQNKEKKTYDDKKESLTKIVATLTKIDIKAKFTVRFLEQCEGSVNKLLKQLNLVDETGAIRMLPLDSWVAIAIELQEIKKLNQTTKTIFADAEQILVNPADGEMLKQKIMETHAFAKT